MYRVSQKNVIVKLTFFGKHHLQKAQFGCIWVVKKTFFNQGKAIGIFFKRPALKYSAMPSLQSYYAYLNISVSLFIQAKVVK